MNTPAAANPGLEAFGYKQELKRSLRVRDLFAYGLAMVSPIAPIAVFGFVFNASRGMVPLVYIIGLVAMAFTAWSYIAMAKAMPVAGSVYTYAGRSMGPTAGFLAGWAMLLDYMLVPSLMYLMTAVALAAIIPGVPKWVWIAGMLAVNGAANLTGIENTTRLSFILTVFQVVYFVALLLLGVNGALNGVNGAHFTTLPLFNPEVFSVATMFSALSIAVLSFLGFDAISTLAEEAKDSGRAVAKATALLLPVATLLFVIQTYLMCLFLPGVTELPAGEATDAAGYTIGGLMGGTPMKIAASLMGGAFATFLSAVTAQAAAARLMFGMARDRKLPAFLAHVSPGRKVPDRALILSMLIAVGLMAVFGDRIDTLASMVNFGALTGFIFVHLSVIAHYTVKNKDRRWGRYLVAPVIGLSIIAYVLWNMDVLAKTAGLGWLAAGVIILIAVRLAGGRPVSPL